MPGPVKSMKTVVSRRQEYSSSTRRALLDSAAELFAESGYAGTSLDVVVQAARVTKGALYHHYRGKQALFEAVFEQIESDAVKKVTADIRREKDPWQKALTGVRSFLEVCQERGFRRIVMQEGPVALGYDRWRESEERSTFALVRDIVSRVLREYDLDDDMLDTFTRIFYGALSSAAIAVAEADDPEKASREVETVIALLLAGLRELAEGGLKISGPLENPAALFSLPAE